MLELILFCAMCSKPNKPIAKPPKPAAHAFHVDTGWLTRAHLLAAAYDGASTGYDARVFGTTEGNPISRAFIGRNTSNVRMEVFGALEVGIAASMPRKYRRPVQIALIAAHVYAGTRNWKTYGVR